MRFIAGMLLVCIVWACERAPQETAAAYEFHGFNVTEFVLQDSVGDCSTDSSRHCSRANIRFPVLTDSLRREAADRISGSVAMQAANNSSYDSLPYASVQEMVRDFFESYTQLQADFPEAFGWEISIRGEILRNDADYFVSRIESYSYAGGAHGNTSVKYTTYSSQSGQALTLDEVLPQGYETALNELALAAFRNARGLPVDTDLQTAGFTFENDRYFNPENFALLDSVIIFYFNQYEIAPYAAGPTEIQISRQALE